MVSDDLKYAIVDRKWTLSVHIRVYVVLQFVVYDNIAAPDVTCLPATRVCFLIP